MTAAASEPVRTQFDGRMVPLPRADVDTDQIMPQQFLKRLEKSGFGEFAFHHWRSDPGFELNREAYRGASVLVTGPNFGCGSSREQAVWGLQQYGFEVIVAASFGPIFQSNCAKNGVLALVADDPEVRRLLDAVAANPDVVAHIDIAAGTLTAAGVSCGFTLGSVARDMWMYDLDEIALTLQDSARIEQVAAGRPAWLPRIPARGTESFS